MAQEFGESNALQPDVHEGSMALVNHLLAATYSNGFERPAGTQAKPAASAAGMGSTLITELTHTGSSFVQNGLRGWGYLSAAYGSYCKIMGATIACGLSNTPPQTDRQPSFSAPAADTPSPLPAALAFLFALKNRSQCSSSSSNKDNRQLIEVANFGDRLTTSVEVAADGRLFVNFPHWSEPFDGPTMAVVNEDGSVEPYPDEQWNSWQPGQSALFKFVSVKSLHIDRQNRLWILDPGAVHFDKVIPGAAKLVQVDLATQQVVRVIRFNPQIAAPDSYFNDVRVDPDGTYAYITDSRLGHLVVVDLTSGRARIVLHDHPSTKAEAGVVPTVEGIELRLADGEVFRVQCNGIAVTRDYVYYHAVTARTLYRIKTALLKNQWAGSEQLHRHVEKVADTGISDGLLADRHGNIYLTAVEKNAIDRLTPDGRLETFVQDARLQWPDSLAIGPDHYLYIAVAQVHRLPVFSDGRSQRSNPYRIFKVKL